MKVVNPVVNSELEKEMLLLRLQPQTFYVVVKQSFHLHVSYTNIE